MILLVEPISKQISLYVPAYPLPLMEIGSFIHQNRPEIDIQIYCNPIDGKLLHPAEPAAIQPLPDQRRVILEQRLRLERPHLLSQSVKYLPQTML